MKKIAVFITSLWLVSSSLGVGFMNFMNVGVNPAYASSGFAVSESGGNPVSVGSSYQFAVNLTAQSGVANAIVDIEIYGSSGNKVYQTFFENQNFGSGETHNYQASWTPSAAGNYTVKAGVFGANWSPLIDWDNSVAQISVAGGSAGAKFGETGAVNPATPYAGQTVNLSALVSDSGSSENGMISDLEVYDASGNKVFQKFFTGQDFTAGESKSYSAAFVPSSAGSYSFDVGVFTANWSSNLSWSTVDKFSVSPAQTASSAAFSASGSLITSSASAGSPVVWNAEISNSGGSSSNMIADFEVRDSSGNKVFQKFFTGQDFPAGGSLSYSMDWTPSSAGNYSAEIGVFTPDWSSDVYWNTVANVSISNVETGSGSGGDNTANTGSNNNSGSTAGASTVTQSTSPFYVDPDSDAAIAAASLASSDPSAAKEIEAIASEPQAVWFGGWNANVESDANNLVTAAAAAGKIPVLVAYNIPDRDCGGYSAGGAETQSAYNSWIQSLAKGIGSRPSIVILEPDGVANIDCLSSSDQAARFEMLSQAVQTLKSLGQTKVYIDAGNPNWISAPVMASRLNQAGIAQADGFALNVSNFYTTAQNESFGDTLSSLLGGKHYVIDTSRNGNGSNGEWCNPPGRALGTAPTTNTGNSLVDAFLWVKRPGESDGTCNGGPPAGTWWTSYAEGLAQAAGY